MSIFLRIAGFPLRCLFDPRTAKLDFDRWVNRYDDTKFSALNRLVSLKTRIKMTNRRGLKVNLACGDGWHCKGWIGIDCKTAYPYGNKEGRKGFDVNCNLLNGLPFQDNSVKRILVSHFLEHVTYNESLKLLKDCYRVLEPGGAVRIVVPDLDLFIDRFIEEDEAFFRDEETAGGAWLGNLTDTFLMNFFSHPSYGNTCHKYAYNFGNLSFRLKQCGFKEIVRSGHMRSQFKEFNDKALDSSNSSVPLFSLWVEATK
jgi:SAM-dependent methyltransferase